MTEQETSFPKGKMNVLLLEGIHDQAQEAFKEEGFPVESFKRGMGEEELKERIGEIYILGIRSKTKLTAPVFSGAKKLLVVGAFCIGTEHIDLAAASKRGVAVFNDEFSNTRSVAELALVQAASLLRRLPEKNAQMHRGLWNKSADGARELRGRTLGIIGYGKIGSQLSVLAESLGMQVIFYNTSETLALGNAKKAESMEEVLRAADIVSIHVDGRPSNRNLIGANQFELMRDEAVFLDLSRGFVTDQEALAEYLRTGKLKGAAIDVHRSEPEGNNVEFTSPLQDLDNAIITPHIGGSTIEAQEDIARFVSGKIASFINSGDTRLSVNYPEIQLPPQPDAHRFLHLHRNVPGVMAEVTSIFGQRGINILGQYLQTSGDLGYVITDVNKEYDKEVVEELKGVTGTIKFRVLY